MSLRRGQKNYGQNKQVQKSRVQKALLLLIAAAALVPFAWKPAQSMVYRPMIEDRLYQLVEMADAKPVSLDIQGWTRVNKEFISVEELEKLALKSAKRLGDKNPQLISEGGNDFRQVRIQSLLDNGCVLSLAAQSLINYGRPENEGETYITVSVVQKYQGSDKTITTETVRGALFFPLAEKPQVLTNIIASKPGRMTTQQQEELLGDLFAAAEAERIDGINTEELCSVTGFSHEIPGSLEVGENQVNLNISIRHHNEDDHTYIYIGSPLLVGEY